ncbi:alpha/beta hydrolase [Cytobacillus sp. FJAT-54145]|uniref:Alpha/beta hydrolase n=1 Tax=Cytobacillus spartinae TaxID=3299023 RepID=A0ABW6KCI6_9BACI
MIDLDFTYLATDGEKIHAKKWIGEPTVKPKVIVQIAHGMAEHIERYDAFAKYLLSKQIFVYGNDHRGHGRTGQERNRPGYFADKEGFHFVVEDMSNLTDIIEKDYPEVPVILFGHSMGSFLARRYIQLYGERIAGVILSGTGGDPGILGKIGRVIASREIKKHGRETPSPLLNKLTFGSNNKSFRPNRTEFDWLTRDTIEVDKYMEDPLCGGVFTAGFFRDLFDGLELINRKDNIRRIPKELPIFLLSGAKDPIGNHTKGVLSTYHAFKEAGLKDVTYKFYEEGRHEMLNETNREEVYEDIVAWIIQHLCK